MKKKQHRLKSFFHPGRIEAGCDEAGRGCLAGPVYAAAVVLDEKFHHPLLDDSKKLTRKQRDILRPIIEQEAIAWSVARLSPKAIDEHNILQASFKAMHKAVKGLSVTPEFLLIDGNRFKPYKKIPFECIIQGDGKYKSIAAASILAKCHRDEYMEKQHLKFPMYHWCDNKGYPTESHRHAIQTYGICNLHRKTFTVKPVQLKLF